MADKKIYIPAGTYEATVIETGITATKEGAPQLYAKFNIPSLGKQITWFGSLKEGKAQEITLKNVTNLGYQSLDLNNFDNPLMFKETQINIVVGVDDKNKSSVNFINRAGGAELKKFSGAIPNLSSKLAEVRKEAGLPPIPKEEVPF